MSWIIALLMILGAFFSFVAALGVLRLPDLYMRTHAATKAGAFGATILLIAAALQFGTFRAVVISIMLIVFFYLTTPVAAQVLGRAAYRRGVKLWDGKIVIDQMAEDKKAKKD